MLILKSFHDLQDIFIYISTFIPCKPGRLAVISLIYINMLVLGFPGGSDKKESACNARDWGSIPRSGGSPEEGKGYPLQARILEWVAIPFSRGFSWPRDWTRVSCVAGSFFSFPDWAIREPWKLCVWVNKWNKMERYNTKFYNVLVDYFNLLILFIWILRYTNKIFDLPWWLRQ